MRIGLVIYGTLATLSGGYLYDRKLVEHLRAQGDQVEIVSLPWRSYRRHLGDNWNRALADQLRNLRVDLLIQDELNHPSLFLLNQRLRGVVDYPVITLVHHLRISEGWRPPLRHLYEWIERRYLQSVDGILCNSATTLASVAALAGKEAATALPLPTHIALPAADHLTPPAASTIEALIERRSQRSKPLRLLFVGNLHLRKGLQTLLTALGQLDRGDYQLDVVGNLTVEPATTQLILTLIKRFDLTDHVHFHGVVSAERLRQHYLESDLLTLPSYEGFGIVYLEALSFGLPVIATTAGAAHELITPGVNGYLVRPTGVDEIAEALRTLAADRTKLAALSLAARQRYNAHPTWAESMAGAHHWLHDVGEKR